VGIEGEPARVSSGKDKEGKDQFIANALADEKSMKQVVAALDKAQWSLASVQSTEKQRRPLAPFITSQLQRDASSKLGFNVRRTMGVAQRLYEGVDVARRARSSHHLHAYRLAACGAGGDCRSAGVDRQAVRAAIPAGGTNVYKGKKAAQDAHEAIRPTDASRTPESIARYLTEEQLKLYRLIWQRFVARR